MTIVYILLAILILELLIFLHELGHFTAGKLLGFRILGFLSDSVRSFQIQKGRNRILSSCISRGWFVSV